MKKKVIHLDDCKKDYIKKLKKKCIFLYTKRVSKNIDFFLKKTQKFSFFRGSYRKIFKFEGRPAGRVFDGSGEKDRPAGRHLSKTFKNEQK